MEDIVFDNGYRAELIDNCITKQSTLRLYSPDNLFLASVPSDKEHYRAAAEGLLYGYFAGWQRCKRQMTEKITYALNGT